MKKITHFIILLLLFSCKSKIEKIKPVNAAITESVYASGIIKSKEQYQVFAPVSGILNHVYVKEGDTVKNGDLLFTLVNEAQQLNKENAALNARFADLKNNNGKLQEAALMLELSLSKLKFDSLNFVRQKDLWKQQIGSKIDLEQKELAFQNAKTNYYSAKVKHDDLQRQLQLNASVSQKNLAISNRLEDDFAVRSKIDGIVYGINKNIGEIVTPQTPLATVGDAKDFILEMQVDEYDILKIKIGQIVMVAPDSYKGNIFEACITRVLPLMNERSKTFIVEATFTEKPHLLYPNTTFEANILLNQKEKALLIPRNCVMNDSLVIKVNGDTCKVKTGLKNYQKIEILSGLSANDELIVPKQ
jgi:multidrug efflux pump subunit AcrA (membrane-fusion protein)